MTCSLLDMISQSNIVADKRHQQHVCGCWKQRSCVVHCYRLGGMPLKCLFCERQGLHLCTSPNKPLRFALVAQAPNRPMMQTSTLLSSGPCVIQGRITSFAFAGRCVCLIMAWESVTTSGRMDHQETPASQAHLLSSQASQCCSQSCQ